MSNSKTWGGIRENAGRPRKPPTKLIRIPAHLEQQIIEYRDLLIAKDKTPHHKG